MGGLYGPAQWIQTTIDISIYRIVPASGTSTLSILHEQFSTRSTAAATTPSTTPVTGDVTPSIAVTASATISGHPQLFLGSVDGCWRLWAGCQCSATWWAK